MKAVIDIIRAVFISPETLCTVIIFAMWNYWAAPFQFVAELINSDLKWGIGSLLVPFGGVASAYKLGTDVISPQGARRVLLDWQGYWMMKNRVVLAVVFCGIGIIVNLFGLYLIADSKSSVGAALILVSWALSATAVSSVGLARWKVREIFGG